MERCLERFSVKTNGQILEEIEEEIIGLTRLREQYLELGAKRIADSLIPKIRALESKQKSHAI